MLDPQVVMLRIGSPELLLGDGQHRESGRAESIRPTCKRKGSKEVRQERRIEHDVARNVPDDGFVEQTVARAENGFPVAEDVPREPDTGSEIVVVAIVNAANLILRHDTCSLQGRQIVLNGRIGGIKESSKVLGPPGTELSVSFVQHGVELVSQTVVQGQIGT